MSSRLAEARSAWAPGELDVALDPTVVGGCVRRGAAAPGFCDGPWAARVAADPAEDFDDFVAQLWVSADTLDGIRWPRSLRADP